MKNVTNRKADRSEFASIATMGTYAKTAACALLVVFICALSNAQSQFSANTTGDPVSTSAYGVPQVPSKMTKHKKSKQDSPEDVPVVNKSALPRFDIVPFRHDGEFSCTEPMQSACQLQTLYM